MVSSPSLLHEAEYFGITPLIRRITVCLSLNKSHCGNLLFHAHLPLPSKLSSSPVTLRRRHKDSHRNNQVIHVLGSHNYIAVGYPTSLSCYKLGDYSEWRPVFAVKLDHNVDLMAFNSRVPVSGPNSKEVFIAVSSGTQIYLWNVSDGSIVANFDLDITVEALIFIASGLVALNSSGVIGVWNTMTQTWKLQHVQPITSYDVAGTMKQEIISVILCVRNVSSNVPYFCLITRKPLILDPMFLHNTYINPAILHILHTLWTSVSHL
eukprot:sb/3468331/